MVWMREEVREVEVESDMCIPSAPAQVRGAKSSVSRSRWPHMGKQGTKAPQTHTGAVGFPFMQNKV